MFDTVKSAMARSGHASAADQSPHSREEYPKTIRLDNGPEFISKELDLWAFMHDVTLDFSRPRKPTDNAFIEAFNGRFRDECLNEHWFTSLTQARVLIETWRRDYNEYRPKKNLGGLPPAIYAARLAARSATETV